MNDSSTDWPLVVEDLDLFEADPEEPESLPFVMVMKVISGVYIYEHIPYSCPFSKRQT